MDHFEARRSRPRDVKISLRPERQMISGDRRLERGENVNLARGTDFEDRAAAVADVQILLLVEGDARGNPHPLHIDRWRSVGAGLVHDAVVAAGNIERPVAPKSKPRRVHHVGDERCHRIVQADLVNRHRRLLAAGAAETGVNVAKLVDRRIGHRMQVVGDGNAYVAGPRRAGLTVASHGQLPRGSAFGHSHHDVRIRSDHHRSRHFADGHFRHAGPRHAFSANLKLAAGDRRRRGDLRYLRPPIRGRLRFLARCHTQYKLNHPSANKTSAP